MVTSFQVISHKGGSDLSADKVERGGASCSQARWLMRLKERW